MKRYKVVYNDCGEERIWKGIKAFDKQHAEEVFFDKIIEWQGDCRGIIMVDVKLDIPVWVKGQAA